MTQGWGPAGHVGRAPERGSGELQCGGAARVSFGNRPQWPIWSVVRSYDELTLARVGRGKRQVPRWSGMAPAMSRGGDQSMALTGKTQGA